MRWLLIIAAILCIASAPSEEDEQKVEKAILHICRNGIPENKIKAWPKHPIVRDGKARERLAIAIIQAAGLYPDVDFYYLVAIAFREGSFGWKTNGALGEESTFQMMKTTAKDVRRYEPYCTLETVEGAAICAAAFLDHWSQPGRCGSIEDALVKYASGKSCRPHNKRLRWIQWDRSSLAKRLRNRFSK